MMKIHLLIKLFLIFIIGCVNAQNSDKINPKLLEGQWESKWITHPNTSGDEVGVFLFKKIISLTSLQKEFIINVSADNRYKLYVNGNQICNGPARGDLKKWRFETVDIAPYLIKGKNTICAKVWNLEKLRPVAQFTARTGLIVQGNSEKEKIVNTNKNWKVMIDSAYSFYRIDHLQTYYVTGPGEKFESEMHPWEWLKANSKGTAWLSAKELNQGMTMGGIKKYGIVPTRVLYPRDIPMMEMKKQFFSKVRRSEGIKNAAAIISTTDDLIIPANSTVSILLDQGELTNAYPQLHFSKGKNSKIKITYAESLFHTTIVDGKEQITKNKGNRDVIKGKKINGNYDVVICDGGDDRSYESLWWRTFRYVQIDITTQEESLQIHQFYSLFTGYPLDEVATFNSSDPILSDIFKVGWRTQRLCAGETFFDCPYYEQLQYSGDTRIQGLVTYYVSGDTKLWRRSINDFHDSRLLNGLTQSRYPSYETQIIPTYSLVWITMLWDYMMHTDDGEFIKSKLPVVLDILQWYEERSRSNGLPGLMEGWNYVDWVEYNGWDAGVPPMDEGKNSAIVGLQYVYTIQKAVELFEKYNMTEFAEQWKSLADRTQNAIIEHCWDEQRGLIADTPKKQNYSQHANILAVLTDAFSPEKQKEIIQNIYTKSNIAQASLYFKFYLAEAMKRTDLGNLYLETLSPWKTMLQNGLTTFAETSDPTRSDCHAWSASPLYSFYSIVCGIEPASPGFNKIKIAPNFGKLEWIDAKMPHKNGMISLELKKMKNEKIVGQVILPRGLDGHFYWNEKQIELKSGITNIDL